MNFELVEPVRILFKDEVRVVGDELGLPHGMVNVLLSGLVSFAQYALLTL